MKKKQAFIPLGQLLTKNHEDRVKDYLIKMEGLPLDEIVKCGVLPQPGQQSKRKETNELDIQPYGTNKQLQIIDSVRNQANSML